MRSKPHVRFGGGPTEKGQVDQRHHRRLENGEISPLQFFQELGPFGLGPGLPHDTATVDRLALACGIMRRPVWQKVIHLELIGMGLMGI